MNFWTVLVGSVLENAEAQSTDAAITALIPGLSNKLRTRSKSLTTRCSVPIPLFPANWFMLIFAPISSVTQPLKNDSKILEKSLVEATFLTSSHVLRSPPSFIFGTGVHCAPFSSYIQIHHHGLESVSHKCLGIALRNQTIVFILNGVIFGHYFFQSYYWQLFRSK